MDRFPVTQEGRAVGELTVVRDGLYAAFSLTCHPWMDGVCRAFILGERGELRLGVPVPSGGEFALYRRIALREVETVGVLRSAELRACEEPSGVWKSVRQPEELFRDSFLRSRILGVRNVRVRRTPNGLFLALPFERGKPFPLPALFCFARIQCVCGVCCVVYAFDTQGNPVIC